jgi:hypothetical protein
VDEAGRREFKQVRMRKSIIIPLIPPYLGTNRQMTVWVFQYACSSHVLNRANKRGYSEAIVADAVLPGWMFLLISRVISTASEDSRAAVRVARGGEGEGR